MDTTASFAPPGAGPSPGGPSPGGPPSGGPPPGGGGLSMTVTSLQTNLALYGYIVVFLFGFFGHINSAIIFLRPTLRTVSTSCLFVCMALSDTIYLLVCIYDFLYVGLGLTPVDLTTNGDLSNALCRFRSFVQSVAMCTTAWLLVTISTDRWLRVRFPFRVKEFCTVKRVLAGAFVVLVCSVTLNSHLLLPSLGSLQGTTICGPVDMSTYAFFFRKVWTILFTCLQTILPTVVLLVFTITMYIRLRMQQQQNKSQQLNQGRRRSFLDRQMLVIMLTSIFLFFATQLPLSLFNILLSPVLNGRLSMTEALDLTAIFTFVASINFATSFYVHCLTSRLFRQEFYNVMMFCLPGRNRRVGVITQMLGVERTQTQTQLFRMQGTHGMVVHHQNTTQQ